VVVGEPAFEDGFALRRRQLRQPGIYINPRIGIFVRPFGVDLVLGRPDWLR
jgi:hypothetical protein